MYNDRTTTNNWSIIITNHIFSFSNQEYIVGGVSYMRVKFYVDGSKRKGIAYLDLKKVSDSMAMGLSVLHT